MNREKKRINYQFGGFTSPKGTHRMAGASTRRVSVTEAVNTARAVDKELLWLRSQAL